MVDARLTILAGFPHKATHRAAEGLRFRPQLHAQHPSTTKAINCAGLPARHRPRTLAVLTRQRGKTLVIFRAQTSPLTVGLDRTRLIARTYGLACIAHRNTNRLFPHATTRQKLRIVALLRLTGLQITFERHLRPDTPRRPQHHTQPHPTTPTTQRLSPFLSVHRLALASSNGEIPRSKTQASGIWASTNSRPALFHCRQCRKITLSVLIEIPCA